MRHSKTKLAAMYATRTDKQIGELCDVSGRTVSEWRRHHGIPNKPRVKRYALDVDFFETIDTEEKAYVLGLLAADGSVHNSGKQVTLALQVRDEHILGAVRAALGSDAPIRDKAPGGFPGSGPRKSITFDSMKLVADLAKYSVVPRKSIELRYPRIPSEFEPHFARGFFDGNGHVRATPKKLFCFMGTLAFIDGLGKAIFRHTGIRLKKGPMPGCWRLSGYGGSADVLRWMYRDATIFLERKYLVFLENWR